MIDHIFRPAAARDAREISRYYSEISQDLDDRFWKELNAGIDSILKNPNGQHSDPSGFRRSTWQNFRITCFMKFARDWFGL